jgi:hypothetical protein
MISIDWGAFGVVLGVSLVAAVGIAVFFAAGIRLLATGSPDDGQIVHSARPPIATFGAGVCFAICIATVLFGLWLIIPQFH